MSFSMKKRIIWIAVAAVMLIAAAILLTCGLIGRNEDDNLAGIRGVEVSADSEESSELAAGKAIDGDATTRWSSENNWDNSSHYIELKFPQEVSVSFVVLFWERLNASEYSLEGSMDGINYETLVSFSSPAKLKRQEIAFENASLLKYLRLSINGVSLDESQYFNLYQNVSLYEIEVYEDKPVEYLVQAPKINEGGSTGRYLNMPKAPEGYSISYVGSDYSEIVGDSLEIYDTLEDKDVEVGFLLVNDKTGEKKETGFAISVPSSVSAEINSSQQVNEKPDVIPVLQEWLGGSGSFALSEDAVIYYADEKLKSDAERFAEIYSEIAGEKSLVPSTVAVKPVSDGEAKPGDIVLSLVSGNDEPLAAGLGKEGYVCSISDVCEIKGTESVGTYWGCVSILQVMRQNDGCVPCGTIRDYPQYEVRGFGIDVARKPVSLDMLKDIVRTMSWYKLNDLQVHLNDNTILAMSGKTDTPEEAMTVMSAFRLEVSAANADGMRLTSEEYSYSMDEFSDFIDYGATLGINVVPEIDTPAHSLSLIKLYPEYALRNRNEGVDQINLENKEAVNAVKDIWNEILGEETGLGAIIDDDSNDTIKNTVNIGMDEYFGKGETYRQYLNEILAQVSSKVTNIRFWGSLSYLEGKTMPPTVTDEGGQVQMNIWSTVWANPVDMYNSGYNIINMQNNHLYIIPAGGYDYLDVEDLYENWEPNKFYDEDEIIELPSYSKQMMGASYMIWNDMCENVDMGICEADLYDRFLNPAAVISDKLWNDVPENADAFGKCPEDIILKSVEKENSAPGVNAFTPYEIVVSAKAGDGILATENAPYGEYYFTTSQKETGCVGFSREGRDYSFDYKIPEGETVELKVVGTLATTTLYVNGTQVGSLGVDNQMENHATFVWPGSRR